LESVVDARLHSLLTAFNSVVDAHLHSLLTAWESVVDARIGPFLRLAGRNVSAASFKSYF
jgi:hypothetical protein